MQSRRVLIGLFLAPHPSPALINSLLSLADSLQAASSLDDTMQREWASEMLQQFAARLLDEQLIPGCHTLQHAWDVAFLLQVVGSWAPAMEDTNAALRTRLSEMLNQVGIAHLVYSAILLADWFIGRRIDKRLIGISY